MNVYKIPDALANKYRGAGYALAVTLDGQLIDIVYLSDILPDFDGSPTGFTDDRLAPAVRRLQVFGQVHAGMLGSWQFTEL